jgi:hypothetical protein
MSAEQIYVKAIMTQLPSLNAAYHSRKEYVFLKISAVLVCSVDF